MTAKKTAPAKAAVPELKKKSAPAVPVKSASKPVAAKTAASAAKPGARPSAKPAAKVAAKSEPPKGKAARKTKVEPGKAGEVVEDFSDVEAEFSGEPEAEATVEDDSKVKAKPLRMKVSRAKERALMREFGLDETALTEEEVAKRRQELKTLIKMGKTRGFLTHQEINDHLPEKLVDNEILEAIVSMLNDMGIAVYEQAPDAATLLIAGGGTTTATEEEAEEAAEAALSTVDSEFGRTTDPVRMYMREMGTV